jgi:hypothetical protein
MARLENSGEMCFCLQLVERVREICTLRVVAYALCQAVGVHDSSIYAASPSLLTF